ncbi:hypothetical protein ACJX0J_009173, partial [Zea mays]
MAARDLMRLYSLVAAPIASIRRKPNLLRQFIFMHDKYIIILAILLLMQPVGAYKMVLVGFCFRLDDDWISWSLNSIPNKQMNNPAKDLRREEDPGWSGSNDGEAGKKMRASGLAEDHHMVAFFGSVAFGLLEIAQPISMEVAM